MAEIDEVIEEHGGWPGAFQGEGEKEPSESPKRPVFSGKLGNEAQNLDRRPQCPTIFD